MSNLKEIAIGDAVENAYKVAIPVLNSKTIPGFWDGLKTNQRRIVYAMKQLGADKKLVRVSEISALVTGKYLESGEASQDESIGLLCRKGFLKGKGNLGAAYLYNADQSQAAGRYINAKFHSSYTEFINSVIEFCPMEDGDYGYKCISRFIIPIPVAAMIGSKGVGLAANTNIPAFTPKSILDAIKNDDYHLLKSSYGVEIVHEKSTLRKIWEVGHGKITYRFKVYKGTFNVGGTTLKGAYIEGNPELFKPNFGVFNKAKAEDLVVIYDLGDKVFVGKQYAVRKIDEDWIYNKLKKICEWQDVYMISLYKDNQVVRCPLKLWLTTVYNDYLQWYHKAIDKRINDCKNEIKVLSSMKEVGKLLIKGKSDESIAKELGIQKWIVEEIGKRSISTLRRDHTNAINKLKSEISNLQSINVEEFTDKLINKL